MLKKILYSASVISLVSVSLFAQQPANPGFESAWTTQGAPFNFNEPNGWATTNSMKVAEFISCSYTCTPTNPVSVFKAGSTNAFSGTEAAKITSVKLSYVHPAVTSFINDTSGFIWSGSATTSPPYLINGYSMTTPYSQFDFQAKYTPYVANGDSAYCLVLFFKRNGTVKDTVAVGLKWIPTTANYTNFTVNMVYNPLAPYTPDTASIIFSATNLAQPKIGSVLYVDDVAFSGLHVGIHENSLQKNTLTLFPNPANDVITITSTTNDLASLNVYDVTGRKVDMQLLNNNKTSIDVSMLSKGLYTYNAFNIKKELIGVGKFSVVR